MDEDKPEVAIFFATSDVLSGLFTLAAFDQNNPHGTIVPFGSGCSSLVYYPYRESLQERQRAVIGIFYISARPCVSENMLTFALPVKRLKKYTKATPTKKQTRQRKKSPKNFSGRPESCGANRNGISERSPKSEDGSPKTDDQ